MQVGLIGLNHKCADLNLREKILRATQKNLSQPHLPAILESYVILITCNRVEIYFASTELSKAHTFLLKVLKQEIQSKFEHKLYSFFRWDCLSHLCRVTAGLDSAVLAETEIQGQVKLAYQDAQQKLDLHSDLHYLFQKSLKIGKQIRSNYFSNKGAPSLEGTVEEIISDELIANKAANILFVGASDINLSILKSLKSKSYSNIFLCNRTNHKSLEIAKKEEVQHLLWDRLCNWHNFDAIIFATKSPGFLLKYDEAVSFERNKLILDLSVPRDVETHFRKEPKVTLLNMDQVNKLVKNRSFLKKEELQAADRQIVQSISRTILSYKRKRSYIQHTQSKDKLILSS
ncbi:MAG: glutamyl-tRNA reductase [Chlamydiales bacterium]|nr:hypothetical protein [Chlamydiales bacterium]NCF70112.1 glutamyl-tRNA reductase [Chlamydiales bacterium]